MFIIESSINYTSFKHRLSCHMGRVNTSLYKFSYDNKQLIHYLSTLIYKCHGVFYVSHRDNKQNLLFGLKNH